MGRILLFLLHFIFSSISKLLSLIPHSILWKTANIVGGIWYYLIPYRKKVMIANLHHAFQKSKSDDEIKSLMKKCLIQLSMTLLESLSLTRYTKENYHKTIAFINEHYLYDALKQNKGVFILSAHTGNWELMAYATALKGFQASAIVRNFSNQGFHDFFMNLRQKSGLELIGAKNSLKQILSALKQNRVVGVMLDQHAVKEKGVIVNFFSQPVSAMPFLAVLADRTDTVIIPARDIRDSYGKHSIIFEHPLSFEHVSDNREENIRYNTQKYTSIIENWIRECPEQWLWTHRRWKLQKEIYQL